MYCVFMCKMGLGPKTIFLGQGSGSTSEQDTEICHIHKTYKAISKMQTLNIKCKKHCAHILVYYP